MDDHPDIGTVFGEDDLYPRLITNVHIDRLGTDQICWTDEETNLHFCDTSDRSP